LITFEFQCRFYGGELAFEFLNFSFKVSSVRPGLIVWETFCAGSAANDQEGRGVAFEMYGLKLTDD
jgi:hypothetical protein